MPVLVRRDHRHWRYADDHLRFRVDAAQPIEEIDELRRSLVRTYIAERVLLRIELAARHTRCKLQSGAVLLHQPALGEPEGEDEHVELLEYAAHRGKMRLAIGDHLLRRGEPLRNGLRTIGIDVAPIRPLPVFELRLEMAVSAIEELHQLQRRVEIAVTGGIDAVAVLEAASGERCSGPFSATK